MHFTYEDEWDREVLFQGDILKRTDEINTLLEEVHPLYLKDDYRCFIILTQSCDLVQRDKKPCNARYITLAACRPLATALEREIERLRSVRPGVERAAGIASKNHRFKVEQFLGSVLNNNRVPYFYLHPELGADFPEACCAFLRLSVSIRTADHYSMCLRAKILQLRTDFQAKLGWLVGELYSRVGTEDFTPNTDTKLEFEERIERVLKAHGTLWVSAKRYMPLLKRLQREEEISPEVVVRLLDEMDQDE